MNNEGDICANLRCFYGKKPKASWFNLKLGEWVCFPCAQADNRAAISNRWADTKRPCLTSKEYMMYLLMK